MKKAVICLMVAMFLCVGITNGFAVSPNVEPDTNISPKFIAIVSCINNLTLNPGGLLTCEGETLVNSAYKAGLTMELQQYINGDWETIKTWSGSAPQIIYLGYNWYVVKGTYRLQLTHTAIDGSTVIESVVKYSRTVTYN